MKREKLPMLIVALTLVCATFTSCKDYDSDIKDLQTQITDNKTAITALQKAMSNGVTILKTEKTTDGYKFTMSDGSTVEIKNGTNGQNGTVPQLRVNAAKNWEASTDDGMSWNEIKDADGKSIADAKILCR